MTMCSISEAALKMNSDYETPVCNVAERKETIIDNYRQLDEITKDNRVLARRIREFFILRMSEQEACTANENLPTDFSSHVIETLQAAYETNELLRQTMAAIGMD